MIETDLRNMLIPSSSAIPAIGNRLYIGQLPDDAIYPCVAMFPISQIEIQEAEVFTDRIQFSCFADYLSSATEVVESVKSRLKRFYGAPSTTSSYIIYQAIADQTTYLYDSSLLKHIKIIDMLIQYRRS